MPSSSNIAQLNRNWLTVAINHSLEKKLRIFKARMELRQKRPLNWGTVIESLVDEVNKHGYG